MPPSLCSPRILSKILKERLLAGLLFEPGRTGGVEISSILDIRLPVIQNIGRFVPSGWFLVPGFWLLEVLRHVPFKLIQAGGAL